MSINEILTEIQQLKETRPEGWCEKVIELYAQAIETDEVKEDDDNYANILYEYAAFLQNNKLYHMIGNLYDRSLTIYRKLARKEPYVYKYCIACVFVSLANLHSDQELLDQAMTEYLEALKIFKALENTQHQYKKDVATTLHNLATLYLKTYEYKKAEKALKKALDIRRDLAREKPSEFLDLVATTLDVMGNLYDKMMNYNAAEESYLEALEIRTKLSEGKSKDMRAGIASVLHNLGALYYGIGDLSKAEHYFGESTKISEELAVDNPGIHNPHIVEALYNLSLVHSDSGNFPLALEELNEALRICKYLVKDNQAFHRKIQADVICQLAGVLSEMGEFDQSKNNYRKALEIRAALYTIQPEAFGGDYADTWVNLATLYCDTNDLNEAEKALKKAIDIYEKLMNNDDVPCIDEYAEALNNLGNVYSDTNRLAEAEKLYYQSLSLREDLAEMNPAHQADVAMTLNNLANLHGDSGDDQKAEEEYKKAKAILIGLSRKEPDPYKSYLAQTLSNLASIRTKTHTEKDAEKEYMYALRIYQAIATNMPSVTNKMNIANTLSNLARLYLNTNAFPKAESRYRKALRIFTELAHEEPMVFGHDLASVYSSLSLLYEKTNKKDKAALYHQSATSIQRILSESNPHAITEEDFKIENKKNTDRFRFVGKHVNDEFIYKYMSLDTAFICLDNGSFRFQQPTNWSDEYEGLYYKANYGKVKNGSQARKDLYACCMALNKTSEPAWKMYSYGGKGLQSVCVEFILDHQELQKQLSNYAIAHNMTVYEGKVNYSQSDYTIQTIGKKINPLYGKFFHDFDLSRYLTLLLLKRQAFSHESEVRFFMIPDKGSRMGKYLDLKIEWHKILRGILIDKKSGEWEKRLFKEFVRKLLPDITVDEYDVHEAPREYSYVIE